MARDPDSADCRQALLEIFTVNDRINQFILENLDPRAWKAKPPGRNPRNSTAPAAGRSRHARHSPKAPSAAPPCLLKRSTADVSGNSAATVGPGPGPRAPPWSPT